MRIVELFGSPRNNGATAALSAAFGEALPDGAEIVRFSAYDMNVRPCIACGCCENGSGCVFGDMAELEKALESCDAIVIASPVYFLSFPAPMKAVIDRFQSLWAAYRGGFCRFGEKKRPVVLLLAAGSPSERGDVIKRQLRWVLPAIGGELFAETTAYDTDRAGVSADALRSAAEAAVRLTESFHGDSTDKNT